LSKVEVYWNLHQARWSVRDQRTRKVVAHADRVLLADCHFKVSQAGRARVLRERRKNVHAFVSGTLVELNGSNLDCDIAVTYDPYRLPNSPAEFYVKGSGRSIDTTSLAYCLHRNIMVKNINQGSDPGFVLPTDTKSMESMEYIHRERGMANGTYGYSGDPEVEPS